jgi:hypothetical protein
MATFLGRKVGLFLDVANFGCKIFVFDGFTKPAGVISSLEMVEPGGVIDSFCQLGEEREILGA